MSTGPFVCFVMVYSCLCVVLADDLDEAARWAILIAACLNYFFANGWVVE